MTRRVLHEIGAVAAALAGADRSGILHALRDRPRTANELASELGLDARAVALVLDVLEANRLVIAEGGNFHLGAELDHAVGSPWGVPGANTGLWTGIETLLRSGQPAGTFRTDSAGRGDRYKVALSYLSGLFANGAETLAQVVLRSMEPHAVLDVGAGSAVWSRAIVSASSARATALDLPPVTEALKESLTGTDLAERYDYLGGDYHDVAIPPRAHDLVIAANVLHLEVPPRAEALVARLADATSDEGCIAIVDMLGGDTEQLVRSVASYALHLALRVPGGRPHPQRELERWLRQSGFDRIERADLDPALPGLGVLMARRAR